MQPKVILESFQVRCREKTFEFEEHDTFLFGRQNNCHARIREDKRVSRHHFLLEANPPDVRIRDLGSRNGTNVNDVKYGGREKHETPEEGAEPFLSEREFEKRRSHSGRADDN